MRPRISFFHGISIYMYFSDHGLPHFHAAAGEHEAKIMIESLQVIEGHLPRRALRLVRQWGQLHHAELIANWDKASRNQTLDRIDPLP